MDKLKYSEIIVMRIKTLCKQRGIAYNKLASMSGLNQSTIDNIVRGLTRDPRIKTIHHIAIAFNMTVAEFLDYKELNEVSFDEETDYGAD
ncbi:MAG: helix-turn-helix domain-containing protein [Acetanaerobacterium sp.]